MERPEGPLHIKYRPQNLDEIFGNEETIFALKTELRKKKDKVHTFLLIGPRGCGKTTIARIIAKMLNCNMVTDFKEYNAANDRGIETAREISSQCSYAPMGEESESTIYLLDEAHRLTKGAAEALLKPIEDGAPPHAYFIFSTTNPEKLIPTLVDRCTVYKLGKLQRQEMMSLLKWVLNEEKREIWPSVIREILIQAEGFPRKALVLLNQAIGCFSEDEAIQVIKNFQFEESILSLCQALNGPEGWKTVSGILQNLDENPEEIRQAILGYFNKILLGKEDERIARIMNEFIRPFDRSGKPGLTLACFIAKKMI